MLLTERLLHNTAKGFNPLRPKLFFDMLSLIYLAESQLSKLTTLLILPKIVVGFMKVSAVLQVCKRMDTICQRVLNQGFLKVERYHSLCQRQVKAQLPR
uniref:Uncharacterized protein n=1 Tax=Oryzias sinensis TaxID=183150 RepID=A0A8C8DEH7_9TELE